MTLILIYVVVFGALMVFMTTRGRKRQAAQANAMQSALVIGAEVRTIGGLVGTVTDLTDEYVVIETTPGVKLKFTKQAVAGVVAPEVEALGAEPDAEVEEPESAEETPATAVTTESSPEDAKDEQKV
ncbi:MAG TPA: preprotein translocase subunit YajC [Actinospica sp.]|nr:preprotein translocase subunit YajC [Actinospica sp.]